MDDNIFKQIPAGDKIFKPVSQFLRNSFKYTVEMLIFGESCLENFNSYLEKTCNDDDDVIGGHPHITLYSSRFYVLGESLFYSEWIWRSKT